MRMKFPELRQIPTKMQEVTVKLIRKFKSLSRKKQVILGVVVVALLGGGIYTLAAGGNEPVAAQVSTGVVKTGDVKKVITATGTANLSQVMPLSFEAAGTIQEILVNEGDLVKAGQPLIRLDTTTLEQELKEATENLASAQAGYEQTLGEHGRRVKSDLVQAEKSLLAAKQKADLYYLENQYHLAELKLKAAERNLAAAQGAGEVDTYQLQTALSEAQLSMINAQNLRDGEAAKDLEVAQASYEAALETMKAFENGTSKEYLTAKANLTQSETKFVAAQEALDNAILTAPMDGTILSSEIELYQTVGENKEVMSLVADAKDFKVSASVDQADITAVAVGQKVEMTLDTAPDKTIVGTVSGVSLKGTNTQNVITYGITIDVDEPSEILRDEMNVNVSIITEEVRDVLIIPSQALSTQGDQTGVYVLKNQGGRSAQSEGTDDKGPGLNRPAQRPQGNNISNLTVEDFVFTPIETGLNDGKNVEAKSGLTEGQVVMIPMNLGTGSSSGQSPQGGQRSPGGIGVPMGGSGVVRMR